VQSFISIIRQLCSLCSIELPSSDSTEVTPLGDEADVETPLRYSEMVVIEYVCSSDLLTDRPLSFPPGAGAIRVLLSTDSTSYKVTYYLAVWRTVGSKVVAVGCDLLPPLNSANTHLAPRFCI
jgi:hypothetical protein